MATLYGTQSNGQLVPVQADSQGRLVAELANQDDIPSYQDGLWTPFFQSTAGGFDASYDVQAGSYYRIGQWVTVQFRARISAVLGTSGGTMSVGNLPFLCESLAADLYFPGYVSFASGFAVGWEPQTIRCREDYANAELRLYRLNTSTNTWQTIGPGRIQAGCDLEGGVTYRTNDTTLIPTNGATLR